MSNHTNWQIKTSGAIATNTYSYVIPTDLRLVFAHVIYTADGNAGNRDITLHMLDTAGNTIANWNAGAYIIASATNQHVEFMQGVFRETAFFNNTIQVSFPMTLIFPSGYTLKINDSNNISAGDSMSVSLEFFY